MSISTKQENFKDHLDHNNIILLGKYASYHYGNPDIFKDDPGLPGQNILSRNSCQSCKSCFTANPLKKIHKKFREFSFSVTYSYNLFLLIILREERAGRVQSYMALFFLYFIKDCTPHLSHINSLGLSLPSISTHRNNNLYIPIKKTPKNAVRRVPCLRDYGFYFEMNFHIGFPQGG